MLPIICIALVLCLGHATGGARVMIWMDMLRLEAAACCDMDWISAQRGVGIRVYCTTDQCRRRLEAEGSHSEHLLWRCLPDIPLPVVTHYKGFFSRALMTTNNWLLSELPTFERTQQTFSQRKSFAFHKLVWWHFQAEWAMGFQFVFLRDNVNNQKYVWITLLKMTFLVFSM